MSASTPDGPHGAGRVGLVEYPRAMPPARATSEWVYLWGWPLRAMHWIAAACIVVLTVTGFYIGKPYFAARRPRGPPSSWDGCA